MGPSVLVYIQNCVSEGPPGGDVVTDTQRPSGQGHAHPIRWSLVHWR